MNLLPALFLLAAAAAPPLRPKPPGFDWERGSVRLTVRPAAACRDFTYHMLFDVAAKGKGRIYLIKSGKGGANGLFMCVADERGHWMAAAAYPGRGYDWKPGERHEVAGSWDSARGYLALFFDGREVKTTRVAPFRIGPMGDAYAVGRSAAGGQPFAGRIENFRLSQDVLAQSPIASAKNCRGPDAAPWRLIDRDRGDLAAWAGRGAPNWVEIELPRPVELARVVVYPGALRYARYPSTECSPRTYVVQGWVAGRWSDLAPAVRVPRYRPGAKDLRVVTDLKPTTVRRFRLLIRDIYDRGFRVSSPDKPVVPPDRRSVVIREIEWFSARQVADAERRLRALRSRWAAELDGWRARFDAAPSGSAYAALARRYGRRVAALRGRLARLDAAEPEAIDRFERDWLAVRKWLDPWSGLAPARERRAPGGDGSVGRLMLLADPGDAARRFYPASLFLDLDAAAAALGCPAGLDPYRIEVVEIDAAGRPRGRVPCRFDPLTPARGRLWWTLRGRTHTRFAARLRARAAGPPPVAGGVTLGACDRLYFRRAVTGPLPSNLWAAFLVDWDSDGRQDVLAGRWTDYCHFWRNIGTAAKPVFHGREHWRLIDEDDRFLLASPRHPGLGFSIPMPVDFDADGRLDLFLQRYSGGVPTFYRNLGPRAFPILARGAAPEGLEPGRFAFGDLDGDGRPDAVGVRRRGAQDEAWMQRNEGLSPDGRPVFGPPRKLSPRPPRRPGTDMRAVPALADIDADGDLDLFIYSAPTLWRYDNVGDARRARFARGRPVLRRGKPLSLGDYYPWISWGDWDGDGDLDLVKCTGLFVYLNEGDRRHLRLGKVVRPAWTRQQTLGRSGLRAHAMVDWDQDGDLDYVTLNWRGLDLRVYPLDRGFVCPPFVVDVDPNKNDWFGCPDPGEYYSLYGNVKLVDWDRDGDLDLFVTSEHSWRFGYIHYYENLGGRFGPERELRPGARSDYVKFVPGRRGQAALVDETAWADYLSFRTADCFDPWAGVVRFWFKPAWRADDGRVRCFFCTARHPRAAGVRASELKAYYQGRNPALARRLPKPFALYKTAEGTLRFQTWGDALETPKLRWPPGQWRRIEVAWGPQGRRIAVDGKTLAESRRPAAAQPVGARFHIGSNQTFMMQRLREYPSRRRYHPKDWTFLADGAFDDFEILDARGRALLTLPFDGNCDSTQGASGARLRVGYRCTPGFADLNGDGRLDMVMMLNDGTRFRPGRLYLFPGAGGRGAPRFGPAAALEHPGGAAFRSHVRTQITCVDWDRDGLIDLILSTENCGQRINCGVDFFKNVGTRERPLFAPRRPMRRLNALLQAHHEIKLCAVDLTGDGWADLVTSTDPGVRVTYRSYLDEPPPRVRIVAAEPAR